MGFGFKKEERLCSRLLIDRLYAEGHRLMAFPYSVQWRLCQADNLCQVMIVAPKRRFRHAVDRNRVRRLTRECYRLRKDSLYAFLREHDLQLTFSMVYVHNEIMDFHHLGHKMDKLIAALQKDIEKHALAVEDD